MSSLFKCWNCQHMIIATDRSICAYRPINSSVSYDVCGDCWNELMEARDFEE